MDHLALGFLLTLFAGLSTGIGSAIAFFAKPGGKGFLAGSLGFSAGVMIYVSFVELLAAAQSTLVGAAGPGRGPWLGVAGFFAGVLLVALIDALVPAVENPHEAALAEEMTTGPSHGRLKRLGLLTALAIGVHNFPEGFATLIAAQRDLQVGLSIAVAISLHNIPEGIAVSVPIFYATGSRRKAFWLSFASGLAEPVGAAVGYLLLQPFLTETVVGMVLAAVAGVMVFISLDQLIPNAKRYGKEHHSVYGLIGGMAVMAASLLLLRP